MKLRVKRNNSAAQLPKYQTAGSAGFDLHATSIHTILPGKMSVVHTGLQVEVPEGYELQIRPRSGLAFKNQVTVINSPGTIDSDYRGEVQVMLMNHNSLLPFEVHVGDRIAQGVISPINQVEIEEVEELSTTERGSGGFGSTGK